MRTTRTLLGCCIAVAMLNTSHLEAADHLDAPFVSQDGRLDINDTYIFQSPTNPKNSVMIMTVNPGAGILSPTTFNPRGRYLFDLDLNADNRADRTYYLWFSRPFFGRQVFILYFNRFPIAAGVTGRTVGIPFIPGASIHCGTFDDPFFFDLDGFNNGFQFTGDDFFAGLNVSAIVIELPTAAITGRFGGRANVSLNGRTTVRGQQIDRMGRPAINTALIPSDLKDAFNLGTPATDVAEFGPTVQASIEALNGGDAETAAALTEILLPDVLTVGLKDPSGFLNGRQPADDVIDIELSILSNGAVTGDGVDANDVPFPNAFPFLAPAHQ